MVIKIPFSLVSFDRKLARVYKLYLRSLDSNYLKREEFRYHAVLARHEFDKIANEKDIRIAKKMLEEKSDELKTFDMPKIEFPDSPKGVAYNVLVPYQDMELDYWDPLEKAIYPSYFALREVRKQQFIEMWDKMHGPPPPDEDH